MEKEIEKPEQYPTCVCCKDKPANKTNTHYLTDAIIKKSGNSTDNERNKGMWFNFSSDEPELKPRFEQSTPKKILDEVFKKELTDEEIKEYSQKGYAVDNVFCSDCEDIFTEIETQFTQNILPKFRGKDLTNISEMDIKEVVTIRLFAYIQVLRSALVGEIELDKKTVDELRNIVLNYKKLPIEAITNYPLSITYLETKGDTSLNATGFIPDKNPCLIFMCDFVIQFSESVKDLKPVELNGLNKPEDKLKYFNVGETLFKVKVMKDEERLELQKSVSAIPKFVVMMKAIMNTLIDIAEYKFPYKRFTMYHFMGFTKFLQEKTKDDPLLMTKVNIENYAVEYLSKF